MAQPSKPPKRAQSQDKVPTELGFEKRLGEMYKKVLPPPRKQADHPKSKKR